MSWDDPNMIMPVWDSGRHATLSIPADRQKNDSEELIPLLPGFESLLLEIPMDDRIGWVFTPMSLEHKRGRSPRHSRPNADWVGKIISRIGKSAGVVVEAANDRTGKRAKYASAHDLRRGLSQRLADADVPKDLVREVMRHASIDTTERYYQTRRVQRSAAKLKAALADVESGYTNAGTV